ncbi:hypothetical protein TIFTF001_053043 [Ficus carica]|uniref:Uncharacterized protein n=1 Tax=Ficus carica TaxID=3494 RepID=A0AA88JIA0_FICCA|nr:hypothetical protein TIFTF001_053043 [Ficus carica]
MLNTCRSISRVGGLPKTSAKQAAKANMEKHLVSGVRQRSAPETLWSQTT